MKNLLAEPKLRTKIVLIIIFILLAGLYIDGRNVGMYCNATSYQPTFVIQSIVPFRVERETWLIGYGEKINNYPIHPEMYRESYRSNEKSKVMYGWSIKTRCIVYTKDDKPWNGDRFHYIDLRFWEKAK